MPTAAQAWLEASSDHASDVQAGQLKQALVLAEGHAPSPAAGSYCELDGEGWNGQQANQDLMHLVAGALAHRTSLHITTRVRQLLLCCLLESHACASPPGCAACFTHQFVSQRAGEPVTPRLLFQRNAHNLHLAHDFASSHILVLGILLLGHEPAPQCYAGCSAH